MFTRPIIALLFLLCISTSSRGQKDFGVLYWTEDRDLSWSDFKGRPIVDSIGGFFLDLYIESVTVNNSSVLIQSMYEPTIYIFTNTSYADDDLRSDDLLRYFNVHYDLAAFYAHKMVEQLINARNSEDEKISSNLHVVKNAVLEEWKSESTRLAIETEYGRVIERLIMWEKDIEDRLVAISTPIFEKSDYSMTIDLTFGPLIGPPSYDEFLTESTGGLLGLEFAKAPFTYNLGLSGGAVDVKKTFFEDEKEFRLNSNPNFLNLFMHMGYQLVNSKRWKIIPRLGIHYTSLAYARDIDIRYRASDTSFTSGLTIDYNLNAWNRKGNRSMMYSDVALRLGGYYYPMHVGEQNLSHLLLTVGLSWTFGPINVKYP